MRSYWVRVDLKSSDQCPYKKAMCQQKQKLKQHSDKPRNTKGLPEAGRRHGRTLPSAFRGGLADTLTADFWPLES